MGAKVIKSAFDGKPLLVKVGYVKFIKRYFLPVAVLLIE